MNPLKKVIVDFLRQFNIVGEEADKLSEDMTMVIMILKDKLFCLYDISVKKGISFPVILWSLITAIKCCQSEEEAKSIGTGFIIGIRGKVSEHFTGDAVIQIPENINIKDWLEIRDLCGHVNGRNSFFIIDSSTGNIIKIKELTGQITIDEKYCKITENTSSIGIWIPRGGARAVKIYLNGEIYYQIILIRKYGDWNVRDWNKLLTEMSNISLFQDLEPIIIRKLLYASLELSEISQDKGGAVFILGDRDDVGRMIVKTTPMAKPINIKDMNTDRIVDIATSGDGHTILDGEGNIIFMNALFDAKGGRLNSAMDVTKRTDSSGIVISQDALISILDKGNVKIQI